MAKKEYGEKNVIKTFDPNQNGVILVKIPGENSYQEFWCEREFEDWSGN